MHMFSFCIVYKFVIMDKWRRYILWFAQEHVDFRKNEFLSIMQLFNLAYRTHTEIEDKPFWIVDFPSDEEALKYASRSVALRGIYELWSHSISLPIFHEQLKSYIKSNAQQVKPYFRKDCSFKITVETYNKHLSQKEKVERIESVDYLPVEGNVNLQAPDVEWCYFEYWGLDPKQVPETAEDIFFGRLLSNGQRHLIKELSLKIRKFIGNTSMDPQLSLLMANQALVKDGDIVLDPFVGTGSLLVSAAKFGAYVLGTDIDFMMLHARSRPSRITQKVREKDESVRANLKQYGCEDRFLDVIVSDFSMPLWHENLKLNAIITDPPYGIREATERIETKFSTKSQDRSVDMPHFPSTSNYKLHDLYNDLLCFSAKHLTLAGRLVCWIPLHRDISFDPPQHPNMELIACSEQPLTGNTFRILLTYTKKSEPGDTVKYAQLAETEAVSHFRKMYFDSGLESRTERRLRKAAERELGRLEALKRGKSWIDKREIKCELNKARFD